MIDDLSRPMLEGQGIVPRMPPRRTDRRIGHPALSRVLLNVTNFAVRFAEHGSLEMIVMEPAQRCAIVERFGPPSARFVVLGDLGPEPSLTRAVRDQQGQRDEVLRYSHLRLNRRARVLAGAIGVRRDRGQPTELPRWSYAGNTTGAGSATSCRRP